MSEMISGRQNIRESLGFIGFIGGDEFRQDCVLMDKWILQEIGQQFPVIAILPTAATCQKPELAISNATDYFSNLGGRVINIPVYTKEDANTTSLVDKILTADLLYIVGGDPRYLSDVLEDSYCEKILSDALGLGKAVVGSSAGAMYLGNNFLLPPNQFTPIPHFENYTKTDELMSLSKDIPFIGIGSATGVFSSCSGWLVIGEKDVHVITTNSDKVFSSNDLIFN